MIPRAIREALFDAKSKRAGKRKGKPKKGVTPPHLRRFLFKKGHKTKQRPLDPKKKAKYHRLREEMTKTERVLTPQFIRGKYTEQRRFDPKSMPRRWFEAMTKGIMKSSDVSEGEARGHARRIWATLGAEDRRKAAKAKRYDLPLPQDAHHSGGVIRVVKPFNLAEAQIDVTPRVFEALARTGIFQKMRRSDGTIGLVKRAKSIKGNVNIFVDRRR